jgi:HK97 family phage prohead protease
MSFAETEYRDLEESVEIREDGGTMKLVGYAALYDSESVVLPGGFTEVIRPGAFSRSLERSGTDVVALYNHDDNMVLGRQSAGTLTLSSDEKGLRYEITPPSGPVGQIVTEAVRRRDVRGASFAFTVKPENEEYQSGKRGPVRYIREIDRLYDVSVVLNPAYPKTTAAVLARAAQFGAAVAEETQPAVRRVSPLAAAANVAKWLRRV